jgi:hypothetical protein
MTAKTIASALIVAVFGFSLGLPGTVVARDRHHDRHGPGHSGGYYYQQGRRHDGYRSYHYRPYYGNRGYGGPYYYYDDNDYDELLFGLLTGGIIGYTLNQSQQAPRYAYPPLPRYAPY